MNATIKTRRTRRLALASLSAVVVAATLSACGSGGSGTTSSSPAASSPSASESATGTSPSPSQSGTSALASYQKVADTLLTATGTFTAPPTTAPKPQPGKKLWLISCGQAYTSCSIPMGKAEEAAKSIGWETKLFDTQGDPSTGNTGIRQAIADKADAIFLYYLDCAYVKAGLEDAKKAGIKIAAAESFDCGEADPAAKNLFDYSVTYSGGLDGPIPGGQAPYAVSVEQYGQAQGNLAVVKAEGKVNALVFTDNYGVGGKLAAEGMSKVLGSCPGCTSKVVEFPYEDLGNGKLQATIAQQLLKNPDVNVVAAAYDAIASYGLAEAASQAGRPIVVIGGEGSAEGMDLLRAGKITLGCGTALGWEAYAGIDGLNRILQGEQPVPTGMGLQLFDKDHNVPPTGAYAPPFDYEALYKKAWGAS